jgi:hypothetical protein
MAQHLSQLLGQLIEREHPNLPALPERVAAIRPGGDKTWSPKEELGHLIDSAINNHVRFVCAAIGPEFRGPGYAQDDWVTVHAYQDMAWNRIVELWRLHNLHLAFLLERIPDAKLETLCVVGSGEPMPLRSLVEDYALHMQHHLDHLLGREIVTQYPPPPQEQSAQTL